MFMEMAWVVAKRSTCMRLNVGALVVVQNNIVSIGYNGSPPGERHCLGNDCPGRFTCKETIHAEDNALNRIPREVVSQAKDLYVTHSPCSACARLLIANAVDRLFFAIPYRMTDHLEDYRNTVGIYQVTPAGYVHNWFTKELVSDLGA